MPLGAEFRCDHCSITSVLIVDRALVPLGALQKQGEKVCTACGRVAQREARFCQEGHTLFRRCIKCGQEFAVDHQRCDSCGWPQSVRPETVEGLSLAFDNAVSALADSYDFIDIYLEPIVSGAGTASRTAITAAVSAIHGFMMDPSRRRKFNAYTEGNCWNALGSLGPAGVSAILSIMRDPSFCRPFSFDEDGAIKGPGCWEVLARLGPAAREAVPMLRQRIEEIWPRGREQHSVAWCHFSRRRVDLLQPDIGGRGEGRFAE